MRPQHLILGALAAFLVCLPAHAGTDEDRVAHVMEVIAGVCPLSTDQAENHRAHERAAADGVQVTHVMVSQFGNHDDMVSFGSDPPFTLNFKEGTPGFCVASFGPVNPSVALAWLTARYGPGKRMAEGTSWIIHRRDGEAAIYYRPHVPGQTGPAWVVHGDLSRGEYVFGPGAENDFIAFYDPAQRRELEDLDREFGAPPQDPPV
jgi:hypothetical protein